MRGAQVAAALDYRGTPSGFSRLMAPLMSMAMRRANCKDLKMLKRILEESYPG
ncbi:MAG TPA: hypothetical protein VHL58_09280 [Thermoanaerobaculia bacterium]|nr:hypothetical protein [Thermoanaerobaculia bacterium]